MVCNTCLLSGDGLAFLENPRSFNLPDTGIRRAGAPPLTEKLQNKVRCSRFLLRRDPVRQRKGSQPTASYDVCRWEGRGKKQTSPPKDDGNPVSSKRAKKEEIDIIFETLRERHKEKFSDPQLRLWARMQASRLHHDLDNPPNVPAITGRPVTKKRKKDKESSFTDALTGAATAITKILAGNQPVPATPNKTVTSTPTGISPASKAKLSGQYLQQLSSLQQLRENSVLTEEEFQEQKRALLSNLSCTGTCALSTYYDYMCA